VTVVQGARQLKIDAALRPSPQICSARQDARAMEPALSTLSEIAANLLKRERMAEGSNAGTTAQQAVGLEQLMALSREKDVHKWQEALSQLIADSPGKRRVTVLRVIEGGLS
jgi:hypothetical protein